MKVIKRKLTQIVAILIVFHKNILLQNAMRNWQIAYVVSYIGVQKIMKATNTFTVVSIMSFMFLTSTSMTVVANGNHQLTCQEHTLSVTLAPDEVTQYQVVGWLCARGSLENKTVHVLLSGSTYGSVYWDFPYKPNHYSYVRAASRSGYATFNIDRIGIGASDHPPGNEVTVDANAFVAHQIIQALRSGDIGGVAFEHVILVGHSLGSTIAILVAAQYPEDSDGVILTGWAHNGMIPDGFVESFFPANLDSRFSHLNLDDDYVTTLPGTRELFYYLPMAKQEVIAVDEATRETLTTGEMSTSLPIIESPISQLIEVPVLIIIGQYDVFFCSDAGCNATTIVEDEQDWFSPEACIKVAVVRRSGHDLNLHRNAHAAFAKMLRWADRHVGVNGAKVGVCSQ